MAAHVGNRRSHLQQTPAPPGLGTQQEHDPEIRE
jgi:hypothetical protein